MPQDDSIKSAEDELKAADDGSKIIHAYVDAFNRGDIDALRQIFTEDGQVYGVLGWGGLDEVAPIWRQLHEAFAMQLQIEDIIVQDDRIVARFTERGTSQAPFRGQGPTGKSSEVVAIEWFIIRDQRIYQRWGVRDSASHFRQMGLSLG
ncbi:hypothetical protein CCAX7_14960 [Capsulimonas corticalis]|uniref:Uncharacterized protein n=1 Tax=Capsulimonas corticalis TaxID=2219043 RepID=A0A402CZG9_9BACT|nr:ester cyclase [Capsulimonas corticalis]BDI29445.1 hypothetical protein CCAX7_14960 [Capsulimonas corticalis]